MRWRRPSLKRTQQMPDSDYHALMALVTYVALWIATLIIRWGLGEQEVSGFMLVALSGLPAGICAGLAYTTLGDFVIIVNRDERVTKAILEKPEEEEEEL